MIVEPDKREANLFRQTHRWTLTVGSLNPQPANFTENSASVAFRPGFLRVFARRGSVPPRGRPRPLARHRRLGKRLSPIGVNFAH